MPPEAVAWLIVVNMVAWAALQLGLAWAFIRMPAAWFVGGAVWRWEADGRAYERYTAVKKWKAWLPDGASWFAGGVPKRRLAARSRGHLAKLLPETTRGERTHWAAIAITPLFLLWNPLWAMPFHLAYALAANLPCIIVQRYNRARLLRTLS